jgi:hypothetical protein
MTIQAITPSTLYLILPFKVSQLAVLYVHATGCSMQDAIHTIYTSRLYKHLEDESTKLWHLDPVALLELLLEERGSEG